MTNNLGYFWQSLAGKARGFSELWKVTGKTGKWQEKQNWSEKITK